MPDISVITLSRNIDHFESLAASLGGQVGGGPIEKILVNNANTPALTAAALRDGWRVVEPGYNTSFSEGNNIAARAAAGQWLLLLNDDLRLHQGFLQEMHRSRGKADIAGALLLHEGGSVNHAGTSIRAGIVDHIGRHDARGNYFGCPLVPSVTFAAVLIQRSLWEQLGGLDERYYYGWEDTDFCLRALEAGAMIRCNRDAVATHDECGTRARGGSYERENAAIFRNTWADRIHAVLREYNRRAHLEPVEGI